MPLGSGFVYIFDYQVMPWFEAQDQHMEQLMRSWERQDATGVSRELSALGSPDYLVFPTARGRWLWDVPEFNYRVETIIHEFTIMREITAR
jgi:hypothetical protein